jgi:hypothetical protein
MNKREFMAAGMATVAAAPSLAASPGAASHASLAPAAPGPDPSRAEAPRVLLHAATGQRVALHLEPSGDGLSAHFNLLAAARSVPPDRRA